MALKPYFTTLALALLLSLASAVDKTTEEKAYGRDVVDATIDIVEKARIFPPNYKFLYRVAYVETHFGHARGTFSNPDLKGIWPLTEGDFNLTKHHDLSHFHIQIHTFFDIDWGQMEWDELNIPLHSCLAAQLLIQTFPANIPQLQSEQSQFWLQYFTHKPNTTEEHFQQEIEELQEDTHKSLGKLDLVVVLDTFGSHKKFEASKEFLTEFFHTFTNDTDYVRKGLIFSRPVFSLSNNMSANEIEKEVDALKYKQGRLDFDKASKFAVDIFKGANKRDGVPRVLTFITNGTTEGYFGLDGLERAKVQPFFLVISRSKPILEIPVHYRKNIYYFEDFDSASEFLEDLHETICKVPQHPHDKPYDILWKDQTRFYRFNIPHNGLTVKIVSKEGSWSGYYSFSYPQPNSAIYDGTLGSSTFFPYEEEDSREEQVKKTMDRILYLSIIGSDTVNAYDMEIYQGNMKTFPVIWIVVIVIAVVIALVAAGIFIAIMVMKRRREPERMALIPKQGLTKGG